METPVDFASGSAHETAASTGGLSASQRKAPAVHLTIPPHALVDDSEAKDFSHLHGCLVINGCGFHATFI